MERVLDLTLKLADEGLSPAEQGELERLIEAEPLARRRHLQMLEVEAALRTARHAKSPDQLVTAPSSSLVDERRVSAVLKAIDRPAGLFSWRRGTRLRTTALVAAGAMAAVAALVLWNPPRRRPQGQPGAMARTTASSSGARHQQPAVSGRRGWSVAVLPVQAVAPADHVNLDLGDTATLEVRGRAVLGIERAALAADDGTASRVTLEEGTVAYHRPGVGAPQTAISTPHADVLVRAGRALVTVTAEDTRVNVLDGQATLALRAQGRTTAVSARQGAVVTEGRASVAPLRSALLLVGRATANAPEHLLDQLLLRRLENLSFAAEVLSERELRAEHLHRSLLVISPTVSALMHERVEELSLKSAPVPILCSRPSLYQDLGMTGPGRANGEFSNRNKKYVSIPDSTHPLAAGLSGEVRVLDDNLSIGWGLPAAGAARVALMRDKPERAAIFAYERDAPLLAPAGRAAARRTGFFLHPAAARFMNDQAWQLFDAAVRWTAADPE